MASSGRRTPCTSASPPSARRWRGWRFKLGTPLVQRGKELRLTDAGKRLFEHAVDVLRDEQQTLEDIAQLRQARRDPEPGLSASINRFLRPELVSAYYPGKPSVPE